MATNQVPPVLNTHIEIKKAFFDFIRFDVLPFCDKKMRISYECECMWNMKQLEKTYNNTLRSVPNPEYYELQDKLDSEKERVKTLTSQLGQPRRKRPIVIPVDVHKRYELDRRLIYEHFFRNRVYHLLRIRKNDDGLFYARQVRSLYEIQDIFFNMFRLEEYHVPKRVRREIMYWCTVFYHIQSLYPPS